MSQASIVPQLQEDIFAFCKVQKRDKKPFEPGWSKKGYKWNDPGLQAWLDAGGNYGVLGGHGDLIILDADDMDRLQELKVIEALPETFTVRTPGRGGMHFYYICPGAGKKMALYDPEKKEKDKNGREIYAHVADLASHGMQCVGPTSVRHFPGEAEEYRSYQVINDIPITKITLEQLQEAIKILRTSQKVEAIKPAVDEDDQPEDLSEVEIDINDGHRWIEDLRVEDILMPDNIIRDDRGGTGEIQGTHPIHGSESGRNFSINVKKNTWVCYRCHPPDGKGKDYCGGGPWELLGVREGILSCEDCYKGWRRDLPKKWAALIKRAKELGYSGPRLPGGDGITEIRRDLVRYCVEVIMGSEHIKTLHSGEILYYENGVYKLDGEVMLKSLIEQLAGIQCNVNVRYEVIEHIKSLTYENFLNFDKDPYRISVKNGILNLRSEKLEPHSPDFLTVVQLPVEFKPEAMCPRISKFMSEIVKPENVPILEEMAGYCLFKGYPIHKGFILLGDGRNGKSTWINLLIELISLENTSSVPLQKLGGKFKASEMKGKLMNFYTDIPDAYMQYTDVFKIVTSGDPMSIEEKYKAAQKMISYAKQVFSANSLPVCHDNSYGFFSRLVIIDFPNRFEGATADIHLMEKLSTPEELSGFLNLAISGLRRLLANKKFSYDMTADQIREEYNKKSKPVEAIKPFIQEATVSSIPDGFVLKEDLWQAYQGWCLENDTEALNRQTFLANVPGAFRVEPYFPIAPDGKRLKCWKFLEFNEEGMRLKRVWESHQEHLQGSVLTSCQDEAVLC